MPRLTTRNRQPSAVLTHANDHRGMQSIAQPRDQRCVNLSIPHIHSRRTLFRNPAATGTAGIAINAITLQSHQSLRDQHRFTLVA